MYSSISPKSLRCIISIDKKINTKIRREREVKGVMLLATKENYLEVKFLTIYVNEEQHLPY